MRAAHECELTVQLVRLGVHPLDIVIATWSADTGGWAFRSAVDHLFWTHEDQARLDRALAAGELTID